MRSSLQRSLVALTSGAALLAACSGSDTSAPAVCAVSAVSVSPAPGSIEVGASVSLNAQITQQNCSGLTTSWASSNPAVASVSASGQVAGVAVGGPVTITATVSGKTGTVSVSVVQPIISTITVASPYTNLTVGGQNTITATLADVRGNPITGRTIAWSTSNAAIATVSADGVVQGVALGGPVTITATVEGGKTASLPVTVVTRYAYAFANGPTAPAPYDANSASSYSTVGAPTTITRSSVGTYSVRFRNMAGPRPTAVLASAFGFGSATCKVERWINDSADIVATITCRDIAGSASDQQFFVTLFGNDAFPGRFAFTWADQQSATAAYTPNGGYSFNAANQPVQITRNSTGSYLVEFTGNGRPNSTDPAETFEVTAYGADNVRCEIVNWAYTAASVTVRCSDAIGAATDSRFVLVMLEAGRSSARHALAWANCLTTSCAPSTAYARSTGGAIAVNHSSTGKYDATFTGLARLTGTDNVLLTSYGSSGGFCKVISIDNVGTDLKASIQCYGPGGSLGDRMFDVAVVP